MWEKAEQDNLLQDRNRKLEIVALDKEFMDTENVHLIEEEERHVDDMISTREDIADEEMKDIYSRDIRIHFIARLFKEKEEWKNNLFSLKKFKVIKMPRVL